ncbi:MAG TPA: hypothetical protein VH558_18840 [Pseudolabrys sp.]|jgi:hypothetical protein
MYKTLRRGRIVIVVSNQATLEPSVSNPIAPQLQRLARAGNGMIV